MPGPDRPQVRADGRVRGVLLALAFLGNPLLYAWGYTTGGAFPDSIAYLSLARELVAHGHLALAPWGHVDTALVLPPLYPLLVGLGSQAFNDPILVSQWFNGAFLLAATLPLFLLVERASNAWMAVAVALAVQWQPFYVMYGTSSLTEALFVLLVCTVAWVAARVFEAPRPRIAAFLLLGVGAGFVFLTRQIGIFLLPVLVVALLLLQWREGTRGQVLARGAALLAGFAVIAGSYAALFHAQTSHMPWQPSYRMNQYVVEGAADPAAAPRQRPADYAELYAGRRELRRLLPDASEMLGFVVYPEVPRKALAIANPAEALRNLVDNLRHARNLLGAPALALSALGLLACLWRPRRKDATARLVLAGTVLGYFALLSVLTGLVERYVEVMLPLLVALAAVGVHGMVTLARRGRPLPVMAWPGLAALVLASVLLTLPNPSFIKSLVPKVGERGNPMAPCRALLQPGAGVFSFHPLEAYLVGGSHRVVPNAPLAQIAEYGRRTGTRWLLFRPSVATAREVSLYADAPWLSQPAESLLASPDFAPRCGATAFTAVLFEILDAPSRAPRQPD